MPANTSVLVDGAIGLALLATFATERTEGRLADSESAAAALNGGYLLVCLVGAGLSLVAIGVALYVLPPSASRPSEAAARLRRGVMKQ
jgi:hypothetical protein